MALGMGAPPLAGSILYPKTDFWLVFVILIFARSNSGITHGKARGRFPGSNCQLVILSEDEVPQLWGKILGKIRICGGNIVLGKRSDKKENLPAKNLGQKNSIPRSYCRFRAKLNRILSPMGALSISKKSAFLFVNALCGCNPKGCDRIATKNHHPTGAIAGFYATEVSSLDSKLRRI